MGKVKKLSKTEEKPKASEEKKKVRKNKKQFKYRTYVNRICKSLSIPKVNKDASQFMENAVQSLIDGLVKHSSVMLANSSKTLNRKTAQLSFVSFMETAGAQDDLVKKAIAKAQESVAKLGSSLE